MPNLTMGSHAGIGQRGRLEIQLAVANASLQATAQATQTTLDLGRQFLRVGNQPRRPCCQRPSAATNRRELDSAGQSPVSRRICGSAGPGQVIGVPYSWGGGSLQGPSKGVTWGQHCRASTAQVWCVVCLRRGRR